MRHSVTGQILPARCNSHLCPACSPLHQMAARLAIERGIVGSFSRSRTERVIFLTLTDTAEGEMDLPGFRKRWDKTRRRLQTMWGAGEYALSVEFQKRGALHPHVCIEVDDQVADDLVDHGSEASYYRRMKQLRPAMMELGWGQMVDAETVKVLAAEKVARYGAKAVAGYATKEAAEKFKRAGARYVRPVRLSYGWYPRGLKGAREELLGQMDGKIEGSWERIPKPRTC